MDKKITLYSTITSPYCVMVKQFFDKHKLPYEEIDVSKDRDSFEYMIKISGQATVPVIVIDDMIIIGFNKSKLETLLDLRDKRKVLV